MITPSNKRTNRAHYMQQMFPPVSCTDAQFLVRLSSLLSVNMANGVSYFLHINNRRKSHRALEYKNLVDVYKTPGRYSPYRQRPCTEMGIIGMKSRLYGTFLVCGNLTAVCEYTKFRRKESMHGTKSILQRHSNSVILCIFHVLRAASFSISICPIFLVFLFAVVHPPACSM